MSNKKIPNINYKDLDKELHAILHDRLKQLYSQVEWFKKELIIRKLWDERCKDYDNCASCQFWKLWDSAFIPFEQNATINEKLNK